MAHVYARRFYDETDILLPTIIASSSDSELKIDNVLCDDPLNIDDSAIVIPESNVGLLATRELKNDDDSKETCPNPLFADYLRLFHPEEELSFRKSLEYKVSSKRDSWMENVDLSFLDEIDLGQSEDEWESKNEFSSIEYEETFFKLFAEKLRRNWMMLNSKLSQWGTKISESASKLRSHRAEIRCLAQELNNCIIAAKRCFNFQRYSYIVCTESEVGPNVETISLFLNGVAMQYDFKMDRYSAVNSMCLWDFASVWGGDRDINTVTDVSPYLCLTPDQWKQALKANRIGRWIMMYEPDSTRTLISQGSFANVRAMQLEEIHNTSKLFKLLLSEYICLNRAVLQRGMCFKGRDIIKALEKTKERKELFGMIEEWVVEFKLLNFVFNPVNFSSEWQEKIPGDDTYCGDKERFSRRTIFLCDPIYWTICVRVLMDSRINALIKLLAVYSRLLPRQDLSSDSKVLEELKTIWVTAKEQVSTLRNIRGLLPQHRKLEVYTDKQTGLFRPNPSILERAHQSLAGWSSNIKQEQEEILCLEKEISFEIEGRVRTIPVNVDPPPDLGDYGHLEKTDSGALRQIYGTKLMSRISDAALPQDLLTLSWKKSGSKKIDKPRCSYLTDTDLESVRLALSGVPLSNPLDLSNGQSCTAYLSDNNIIKCSSDDSLEISNRRSRMTGSVKNLFLRMPGVRPSVSQRPEV